MCVRIVTLKFDHKELLEAVGAIVKERFGVSVILLTDTFTLTGGFDHIRNQVNSNWILDQLLNNFPGRNTKLLGLTELDLFSPVLTHVFGEATLGGQAAVVSSHRFHNEFYGLIPNNRMVRSRLLSEVVHELGHTFGLFHCQFQGCVMYPSSYVEQIDMRPDSFCDDCQELINSVRKDRYDRLNNN